jgi:hypothetical protein
MPMALLLVLSALFIVIDPSHAPLGMVVALLASSRSLIDAWRKIGGTALRPALVWATVALALSIAAQAAALAEPFSTGRPIAARFTYIYVLSTLAALGSVLNARRPGGKAWAVLMTLLVVVFLIPWLEDQTLLRRGASLSPLRLDAPWSIFYGLFVAVAVTNYLPTRFGWAAAAAGVLFVLEYLALAPASWLVSRRAAIGCWTAWTMALVVSLAGAGARRGPRAGSKLERLWFWFRDNWGVVWALRVLERFNRAAEVSHWNVRLTWFGLVALSEESANLQSPGPDELERTFRNLMKRFADSWRLDQVTNTAGSEPAGDETQSGGETAVNSSASSDS